MKRRPLGGVYLLLLIAATFTAVPAARAAAELIALFEFNTTATNNSVVTTPSTVGNYKGSIVGRAVLTAPDEGRPNGGDRGMAILRVGNIKVDSGTGLDNIFNKMASGDAGTVALWQKTDPSIDSSSLWAVARSGFRAWQFHIPWSDGNIYFDTSGDPCCPPEIRLSGNPEAVFGGFDFTEWHHYVFLKNGPLKQIYVDGKLLTESGGALPLFNDFGYFWMGTSAFGATDRMDGVLDDFAFFKGALTLQEIQQLAEGKSPLDLNKDTDGDGMLDDWETKYGLNPNDASDALLDFDNDGVNNLTEYQAGTDPADITAPTVVSVAGSATFQSATLTFSEKIDATTGALPGNYSISPALAIKAATVKDSTVTLTTAAQTPGGQAYTVTVRGIKDTSNNTIAANSSGTFYSYLILTSGILKLDYWGNITGGPDVQQILDDLRYPNNPDMTLAAASFDTRSVFPDDSHDNYGATLTGVLTAPETASYNFFLRSDDASLLFYSTDPAGDGARVIAEEVGCCNPFMEVGAPQTTSTPIALTAGAKYFFQLLYKEGSASDYAQVAWRKTADMTPAADLLPISGKYFNAEAPSPAEGIFLSQTPAPNAPDASPSLVKVVHVDGLTVLTEANVSLQIDGVTVPATVLKDGHVLTVTYVPSPGFAGMSNHKARFLYPGVKGSPATLEWSFTVANVTRDLVSSRLGEIKPSAKFTADGGGHTGQTGDFAIDLTTKGGQVLVPDASFLNGAGAKDEMSFAFWQKKYDIADSSVFWAVAVGGDAGFQAHLPWSDNIIYFDTGFDYISARTTTFADYLPRTGITWWTDKWHFFVFSKKGDVKQIWIDGKLFLEGIGTSMLPAQFVRLHLGLDVSFGYKNHALIDDFSAYSTALTEADIKSLFTGTLPSALSPGAELLAHWDFNDAPAVATPSLAIEETATGRIKITFVGVLQSAASANGPYTDIAGAASPYEAATAGGAAYYRAAGR